MQGLTYNVSYNTVMLDLILPKRLFFVDLTTLTNKIRKGNQASKQLFIATTNYVLTDIYIGRVDKKCEENLYSNDKKNI